MSLIRICVNISIHLYIFWVIFVTHRAECLFLSRISNDSTPLCANAGNKNHFGHRLRDSLSYINTNASHPSYSRCGWSTIASQKHILGKERFITRKGPTGFQTIEVKEDPNVSNRTAEIAKKLKEIFPNADIMDIWNNFSYSGPIKKGVLSGRQMPGKNIKRPNYYKTGKPVYVEYPECNRSQNDPRGTLKSEKDIEGIRKACRMAREIMDYVAGVVVEGIFTDHIDRFVHSLCAIKGVFPATLNYNGFPKSVCTSVNEVACHGIPDSTLLAAGDLLKVDLTIYCDGYFGDLCETFMVMPMTKQYNQKFLKTNFMGRSEKNKLIYRSAKHHNMHGVEERIVHETMFLKKFNHMLKVSNDASFFKILTMLYTHDFSDRFNIPNEKATADVAKRLVDDLKAFYEQPDKPYDGRIAGVVAIELPTCTTYDKVVTKFSTIENPDIVFKALDTADPDRANKPYLFSHTFERDVELMQITHEALTRALSVCKPGAKLKNVGRTIEKFLKGKNCRTMANLCGHGIGRNFHELPHVFHEENDSDVVMEPGMVFTIEPVVTRSESTEHMLWPDGWTMTTLDGAKTAQFEHTVLITKDGHEVLTKKIPSSPQFFWERPLEVVY